MEKPRQMQIDVNVRAHPFPKNFLGWSQLAIECVGIANSGGGFIKIKSSDQKAIQSQINQIEKELVELACDLALEISDTSTNISPSQITITVGGGISSLADGRFFVVRNGINRQLLGNQILQLVNAYSMNQIKHELISLKQGLEKSLTPMIMLNSFQQVEMANKSACELLGQTLTALLDKPLESILSPGVSATTFQQMIYQLKNNNSWQGELLLMHTNLLEIPVELTITGIKNHQNISGQFLVQIRDLRETQSTLNSLKRLAFYDPVTNLANRALLKDRLGMALAGSRRRRIFGALLFIDLDHFKQINDVHGHSHGDSVLRQCATILNESLREEDTLARLGGDEFVALIQNINGDFQLAKKHAMSVATKMLKEMKLPLEVNLQKHFIGASIGVTVFPKALETAEDLLREADTAMYGAKAAGRNTALCFEPAMFQAVSQRYQLEGELRSALEKNQFEIYLQPQVTSDGCCYGAEALIRWNHPEKGLIAPSDFIHIAEENGEIIPIGSWVLTQVCQLIAKASRANKPLTIAANVSALQFREPDFIGKVHAILNASGAPPALLTIELTESLLLADASATALIMHELANIGINFSIDDFGTGYSNLGYLGKLPLKELKIDRSFIQDMCSNQHDASLVEALLALAKHLKLEVVAEGVETRQQADYLKKLDCAKLQGYLFSKPVPAKEFMDNWLSIEN